MKTISVEDLHNRTADYVREAAVEPIAISQNGSKVALLIATREGDPEGKFFPVRDISILPKSTIETSHWIIEDRDGK